MFRAMLTAGMVVVGAVLPGRAEAQPPPVNLSIGTGLTITQPSGGTVYHGGSGTLASTSSGGLISAVDSNFTVNTGTLQLHTVPPVSIMMNSAGTTAEPAPVPFGLGLNVVGGTLVPTWRNANTITAIDTNFFTVQSGTLTEISRQGPVLLGVAGGTIGPVQSIALGANVTLSAGGTLSATAPNAGTVTQVNGGNGVGGGPVTSTGTFFTHNQGTIACGGAITITATNGVDNVLVNGGSTACTIDIGPPSFTGQPLRLQMKQGAAPQLESFGTTVVFGTAPSSFTATASAAASDFVQLIGANGSRWAFVAAVQGFPGL